MKLLAVLLKQCSVFWLALAFAGAGYAEPSEWREEKNKAGIAVYTRAVDGSAVREFRGETVIDAEINQLMAVLDDTAAFVSWMHNCREAQLLYKPSLLDRYQYLVNDFPWPAADRVLLLRNQISQDADTRVTRISLQSFDEQQLPAAKRALIPEAEGAKRVPALKGYFELSPQADNRTAVIFQLHLDPGGALPASLVNSLIVDNPYETLKRLREVVARPEYRNFNPF